MRYRANIAVCGPVNLMMILDLILSAVSRCRLLGGSLSRLIPEKLGELETEDLLLILILYLMYRESGDKDLLIIMGAMYLL